MPLMGIGSEQFAAALKALPSQHGLKDRFEDFREYKRLLQDEKGFTREKAEKRGRLHFIPEVKRLIENSLAQEGEVRQMREAEASLVADTVRPNQQFNPSADIIWVYQNLEVTKVDSESAPSTGALALLKVAKKDPCFFFQHIWAPIVKSTALKDLVGGSFDDGTKQIDLLDKLDRVLKDEPSNGSGFS